MAETFTGTLSEESSHGEEPPYRFPEATRLDPYVVVRESAEELLERLEGLSRHRNYAVCREAYCRAHVQLNHLAARGEVVVAPRFRPRIPYPPKPKGEQRQLSNDTQVIDLHWLHARGRREGDEPQPAEFFGHEDFEFDQASEFIRKRGRTEDKANAIGLSQHEQWECASIQSAEIRRMWKGLRDDWKRWHRRLCDIARQRAAVRGREKEWSDLRCAMAIAMHAQESTIGDVYAAAACVYEILAGRRISRQALRRKMQSINKHLGPLTR